MTRDHVNEPHSLSVPPADESESSSDESGADRLTGKKSGKTPILHLPASYTFSWQRLRPHVEQTLKRYVQFISSAINQDKGLKFLQYSLWLASKVASSKKAKNKAAGLLKLSAEISMARYVTRLLAFPTAVEASMNESWTSSSRQFPRIFRHLGKALAWSMVLYYPTEHLAYLHWTAPQLMAAQQEGDGDRSKATTMRRKRVAERWSALSCRGWLAFIVAEIVQGVLQWKELVDNQRQRNKDPAAAEQISEEEREELKQQKQIELQLARNVLFFLPAVQYSLPNWDVDPWLPPDLISVLFWLESVVCLYQASI